MNLDLYLFNWINNFAKKYKWLDFLGIFFARHLPFLMIIFLAGFAFLSQNFGIVFYPLALGLFSRFIVNEAVYFFYKRKRPAYLDEAKVIIPVQKHPSFPSGHASFFFAISFSLLFLNIFLGFIFVVCFALNGIARIFCGIHWPTDILAGAAAGSISSILMYFLI